MDEHASCGRCGRPIFAEAMDGVAICSGCLTAREDVEETVALVRVLERSFGPGLPPTDHASVIVDTVFENLLRRLIPAHGLPWERVATTHVLSAHASQLRLELPGSSS